MLLLQPHHAGCLGAQRWHLTQPRDSLKACAKRPNHTWLTLYMSELGNSSQHPQSTLTLGKIECKSFCTLQKCFGVKPNGITHSYPTLCKGLLQPSTIATSVSILDTHILDPLLILQWISLYLIQVWGDSYGNLGQEKVDRNRSLARAAVVKIFSPLALELPSSWSNPHKIIRFVTILCL